MATLAASALTYAAPGDPPASGVPASNGTSQALQVQPETVQAAGFAPLAAADPPNKNEADRNRLGRTVRFLQSQQQLDGGFGGTPGVTESSPLFSAWVGMALAAGGINPHDQKRPGGTDLYSYLAAHAGELSDTTDFDRVLLVVLAAGGDPTDFGGLNLIETILSRQLPDGGFAKTATAKRGGGNDTIFAILGLSVIDDPKVKASVSRAADWLLEHQNANGGWSWNVFAPESAGVDSDITASAIEALRAAGRDDTPQERRAWEYLRSTHVTGDGGFGRQPGDAPANTASTAWTVQGMWAAGLEPSSYSAPSPLDFLTAMQQSDGMVRYRADGGDNPIWMTAYAAPAFAGYPLPIPAVARAIRQEDEPTAPDGVTAGGGGNGAPNFSRPEPQSKGNTKGGVRRVEEENEPDRGSTKRRKGNKDEPERSTAASNGSGDAGVTRDVGAPDEANGPGELAGAADAVAAVGNGAGAAAGGTQVAGMVVSAARGGAHGTAELAEDAAAPGLISADERRAGALAAGLGAGLALCMLLGMKIERDQLAERLP